MIALLNFDIIIIRENINMNINKKEILILVGLSLLIVAGAVYFLVFQTEMSLEKEDVITENEVAESIKYELTNKNIFSGLGDDSQDETEIAEDIAIQEAQELANPYAEIEEKANPFKNSYKNPFE